MGGQVIVVTGASSGLGKALALSFASRGMTVCALARSEDKLRTMAKEHPNRIEPYPTDVSDAKQVKETFKTILRKHRTIDVLINNAGVTHPARFGEEDFETIDRVIDTNLKGTMYCTYAVLPAMMARKKGRIINIASTAGIPGGRLRATSGVVSFGDYRASKYGVVGFGDALAGNLLQHGILLTTLCPGGIDTPLWIRNGKSTYPGDTDKLIKPEEIVDLVEFLLKQPDSTLYKALIFFPTVEWH